MNPVLCSLSKSIPQTSLQLVFGFDVPVEFSVDGNGTVSLSGYYQPGPESLSDDDSEMDMYDFDGEDDDSEDEAERAATYKKMIENSKDAKKGADNRCGKGNQQRIVKGFVQRLCFQQQSKPVNGKSRKRQGNDRAGIKSE